MNNNIANNTIDKRYKFQQLIEDRPIKLLIRLGVPAVIIALIDEVNGIIDAVFMGQYFGHEAVSSMAVVYPFLILVSALAFLFSEGAGIAVSRYLGARNIQKANEIISSTIWVTVIIGSMLGIMGVIFTPKILDFYTLSRVTYSYAAIYMRVFSVALPIVMLSIILAKILYTEGHVKVILLMAFFQVLLNVGMNYILLDVFRLGIISVSVATIASMSIQSFILLVYINSPRMAMSVKWKNITISKDYFKEVAMLGLPTFATMLLLSVTLGIESKVISEFGGEALSVQTITGYILSATGSVAAGIMNAGIILMSYCVGAKDKQRFFKVLKLCLWVVFGITLIMNVPMIFNSDSIARVFTTSGNLVDKIHIPARIYGYSAPFIFTTNVILFAMQPVGMEGLATVIFSMQQIVFFLPLLFLFKEIGFNFAIAAQPLSEVLGGIITLLLIPIFIKKVHQYFKNIS